jgi:diacylglycerol kinase
MRLLRSFSYALAGLAYLVRTQRNFRIELAIGALTVAGGVWLGVGRGEWLALVLTIALVLALEAVNTAIERAVDIAGPGLDARAKAAKDVSAAAVFIVAIASLAVGGAIFWPRLIAVLGK